MHFFKLLVVALGLASFTRYVNEKKGFVLGSIECSKVKFALVQRRDLH
jgi:hypothetical protein